MVNNNPKLGMQRVHELKPDFKMQHVNAWEEKPSFEKPSLSDLSEQITDPVGRLLYIKNLLANNNIIFSLDTYLLLSYVLL